MIGVEVLASESLLLGWLIYLPVLLWAIVRAPWVELFSDSRRQHLLFGTVFALFLLWLMRRDFDTGVSYHFIGMTAVTLLLDWRDGWVASRRHAGLTRTVTPCGRVRDV